MKKFVISGMMLVAMAVSAQNIQPKLEAFGSMVKATYFYNNGQVQQTGFFKDGKLEGQWVAYDENGLKRSVGEYASGEKTGKWIFFNADALTEVNYQNNAVASIKNWKQSGLANRN